jgi:hypothetical protein
VGQNPYEVYQSPCWIGNNDSYLNRGWCRLEMFYGANIPLKESGEKRKAKMEGGLLHQLNAGRRAHILYGSKNRDELPVVLSPLQNSLFEEYNPANGYVSFEKDKETIKQLVKDLEPYMKQLKVGYEGERNAVGVPHGKGTMIRPDGSTYEGEFKDGKCHGKGKDTFSDGSVIIGEYTEGMPHGIGKFTCLDGSGYEGEFKNGMGNGKGTMKHPDGSEYIGEVKDTAMHGVGSRKFLNGEVYEGDWRHNKKHGEGKYISASGEYTGGWKDDKMHGKGKVKRPDGTVFVGEWKDNLLQGKVKTTFRDGSLYEGEMVDGKKHGSWRRNVTGMIILEEWCADQLISREVKKNDQEK